MLEISVKDEGYLFALKSYFGNSSIGVGLDVNPKSTELNIGDEILIGSQAEEATYQELAAKYGYFDLVTDDGSHLYDHMIKTILSTVKYLCSESTIIVIEDTHVVNLDGFGRKKIRSFRNLFHI